MTGDDWNRIRERKIAKMALRSVVNGCGKFTRRGGLGRAGFATTAGANAKEKG